MTATISLEKVRRPVGGKGRGQGGVTLVELLISLVIGMLVLSGVTYVFFASRSTYGYNETLSRIQENARIALDAVSYDMRMAGFFGCGKAELIAINVIANAPPVTKVEKNIAVTGYAYGDTEVSFVDAGSLKGVAGADILVIRRGAPRPVNLVERGESASAPLKLDCNPDGLKTGDLLLVTDCGGGDLFRATKIDGSKDTGTCDGDSDTVTEVSHEAASNSSADLSKAYGADAQVMRFEEVAFFLRDSGRKTKDGNPAISLFRRMNGVDEEIVDGVVDMRVFYELAGSPGTFLSQSDVGAGNWENVVAVRVHLLLATQEQTLKDADAREYSFPASEGEDGVKYGPDRVMRQEFVQTIALRNRLP